MSHTLLETSLGLPAKNPDKGLWYVLRSWLMGVALLGLLLPGVGPLVDHHFAERYYHHGHLFLGPDGQRHVHDYGFTHQHYPPLPGAPDAPGAGEEVVFLTSTDAAGTGLVFLPAVSMNVDAIFDNSGDGPLLLNFSPQDGPPTEFPGSLPKKPPRG